MTCHLTRFEALKLVAERYGSQEAMAAALGVSQPTVSRWLSQSKQLPAEFVLKASTDTGVSHHHLRPDIYPVDLPPAGLFLGVDQGLGRVSFETPRISHREVARRNVA